MKYILAIIAAISFGDPAIAQHAHGQKGPNGGIMEDVAGVHAELVTSGNTLMINILDEGNKPIAVKGYTASALVVIGGDRETIKLEVAGDSALRGTAKKAIGPNTQITLQLRTAAGKSGQARFKIEK